MTKDVAERSDPSVSEYASWVGRVFDGRYRVDGLLGEGGMGAVFVGEHMKLMKKVAIKVIHPEFAGDGELAERFLREAMTAAQMDHPHVATATDYGTLPEGGGYLVMQYVEGDSLREVIDAADGIGWVRACQVGAQIADALSAAHQKGFVHRDLKPDNVMLSPRDDGSRHVKVLDFGIARVADEKGPSARKMLTRVGTVIGTPGYMSPEQALGEQVDQRADIYALGLLLHEMITGKPVFAQKELTAIVTRQLTETPPRLSVSVTEQEIPPELDDLVAKLLEREKEKRTDSAAEVRERLNSLVLGATLQAHTTGEAPRISTSELAGSTEREPTPLGVSLSKRARVLTPEGVQAVGTIQKRGAPELFKRVTTIATAKTAFALEQVKEAEKRGVPVKAIGIGCAGVAAVALLITVIALATGDDSDDLHKRIDQRPTVQAPQVQPTNDNSARFAPVPDGLAQALADLSLADERRRRREAARAVLEYQPANEVPEFLVAVAELEATDRCRRKAEWVQQLAVIGDPRALPVLERIDAEPRDGCRTWFRRMDCYGCLREELSRTLSTLRGQMVE